jgi:hypothetical protein
MVAASANRNANDEDEDFEPLEYDKNESFELKDFLESGIFDMDAQEYFSSSHGSSNGRGFSRF